MNTFFLPRGIRNHNPGNIRLSGTRWQGQKPVQNDKSFVEFTAPLFGLRALMRVLLSYHLRHQLDTVESIINRWAPPHENPTDHYAFCVARLMRVKRLDRLKLTEAKTLVRLAQAICLQENGPPPLSRPPFWYDDNLFGDAASRALATLCNHDKQGDRS